jgi:hypothetical protein
MDATPVSQRNAATLRAWLLALLRFALTLDQVDRTVALAAAAELDRPRSGDLHVPAFRFFYRASIAVCAAIVDPVMPASTTLLQDHLERIDDPRLKRAFAAALDIKPRKTARTAKRPARRVDLWKGLPARDTRNDRSRSA